MTKKKKLLIVGLDGVPKNLINHLSELKLLPNLDKMVKKGGRLNNLESTIPPLTGPAWVSLATGKQPLEHGCFGFTLPTKRLDKTKTITSRNIRYKTFYEKLEEKGINSVLINLPGTYPPRSKQITITSLLTQGNNFFFPENKAKKYRKYLKNYKLVPNPRIDKTSDNYLEEISQIEKSRFELAKALFKDEKWQLFFILFSATDWVQHSWHHQIMASKKANKYTQIFEEIDKCLGWFNQKKPKDCPLLILSDHGFKTYQGAFYVNSWLKKEGYLKTSGQFFTETPHERNEREEQAIIKSKSFNLDLSQMIKIASKNQFLYRQGKKIYKKIGLSLPVKMKAQEKPDFSKTKAYYHSGTMGIYINDQRFTHGIIPIKDKNKIVSEIVNKLEKLKDPKNKKPVFKKIIKVNQKTKFRQPLPDILFELSNFWPKAALGPSFLYEKLNHHSHQGIFLSSPQKKIQRKKELSLISIYTLITNYFNQ